MSAPAWTRIDAIANARESLADYQLFIEQSPPASDDYLFSEPLVRFSLDERDRLLAPADVSVRSVGDTSELSSASLGVSLRVPAPSAAQAERVFAALDGQRSGAEVCAALNLDPGKFWPLMRAALGRLVFAHEAVPALEARISGTELVRFVGTPYEIERNYWSNMADVRDHSEAALARALTPRDFVLGLRRLHVLALLGAELDSFYRPQSRITSRGAGPGVLYEAPLHSEPSGDETVIRSGPRVGVPLIGGERYQALVCAHDPEALAPTRALTDATGVAWGRVVFGRSPDENQSKSWFLPPRPLSEAHFASLFAAFQEARSADAQRLVPALARFHYRFVRLHPFRCANQSLSMNLVNGLLLRARGASMPHHLLDQFALRLREPAYETVFARAVAHTSLGGKSSQRWSALRQQKQAAYTLIQQLQQAHDEEAARALCRATPAAARAALIDD